MTDMMEKATDLRVVKKGGGSIINYPGVFSIDSKFLFVACGNTIHSYGTNTGELITSYEGLEKDAIGVSLHPTDSSKIVSVSVEGELVVWQYAKQVNQHFTIDHKIMLGNNNKKMTFLSFLMIQRYNDGEKSYVVCVTSDETKAANVKTFCAVTGKEVSVFPDISVEDHCRSMFARYHEGEILLAAIKNKTKKLATSATLTICIKQKDSLMTKRIIKSRIEFTCVVCHPNELCVLTGDRIGNIRVYLGLCDEKPSYASCHWHALPVETIAFSNSGNYFFSGGGECVLVRWLSPKDKRFIPRLPAEIACIATSPENRFVAVSTKDNGIQLIDSSFNIRGSIQHFSISTPPPGVDYVRPSEMAFDPRSKSLVMNARVGHIQFFSLEEEKTSFLLDIVCRNYLSQERSRVIKNTEVVKFVLNADGSWLATVEFCDDSDAPIEVRIKFWEFNKVKQKYELNTSAENPHRGKIYAVRFRPSTKNETLMCITIGEDKKFRTWTLEENSDIEKKRFFWRSENIAYYRDHPARALSFSVDGSLVAVTFGPTLTVWVPGTNQIKCSLTPAHSEEELSHVEFGQKSVHLVVTGSNEGIAVWNILTLSLVWVTSFNLCVLVSDPESDVLAAFSSTNDVVVFSPKNHRPIFKQNQLLPDSHSRITNALFVPLVKSKTQGVSWQMSSQLYFFTSKQELLSLENPVQDDTNGEEQRLDVMPATPYTPLTPYSAILAQRIKSDVIEAPKETQLHLGTPGFKSLQDFMEGPAHTMPPLSFLAGSLMLSFVATKDEDPNSARVWKFPLSEEKMETNDDSDYETEIQTNSVPEVPNSDSLAPESKNTLLEIEKKLSAIQRLPLNWVSQLLH